MATPIKYVAFDSTLGRNASDLKLIENVLENKRISPKRVLLLQFSKSNNKMKSLLESHLDTETVELENKASGSDIKKIFQFFSTVEKKPIKTIQEKIRFGKKILYVDAVAKSFIRKFKKSQECPGFWNLAIGSYCGHGCTYCFLRLTMRFRPIMIEHANLSKLKSNLKYFCKKLQRKKVLFNAGETSDPLDNEPLLHFWNEIVNHIKQSGNRVLCLTKIELPLPKGR